MINIAIVDDHAIVRSSLTALLSQETDMRVVGSFARAAAAIEYVSQTPPDVMTLDLSMPDMNGMDALPRLRDAAPSMRVLILTGMADELYGPILIKRGASGYVDKLDAVSVICDAVRTVHLGGTVTSSHIKAAMSEARVKDNNAVVHEKLSPRETEVFLKLARGQRLTRVAEDLGLSVKTASTYRNRILYKLRLDSNPALTRYAMANSLII